MPHELIFYHFKTKMDLLLAVVGDRGVLALDNLLPSPDTAMDAPTDLPRAARAKLSRPVIADYWAGGSRGGDGRRVARCVSHEATK